jgi:hypothetical protein
MHDRVAVEQTYPGHADNRSHFFALRNAFLDERYVRIDNRPVFVIFRPLEFPNVTGFIQQWQEMAGQNGLPGIHFIAYLLPHESGWDLRSRGFESCTVVGSLKGFSWRFRDVLANKFASFVGNSSPGTGDAFSSVLRHWLWRRQRRLFGQFANVSLYGQALPYLLEGCTEELDVHPAVTPNWDNTPRSQARGFVLHRSTPELFRRHLRDALSLIKSHPIERRLIFLKSWNEWAEGNYVEPDERFGHDYLKVIREEVAAPRDRSIAGDWPESLYDTKVARSAGTPSKGVPLAKES